MPSEKLQRQLDQVRTEVEAIYEAWKHPADVTEDRDVNPDES